MAWRLTPEHHRHTVLRSQTIMKTPISTVLILVVIALAAAACGTTPASDDPSTPAEPSQPVSQPVSQPAEPSVAPSEVAAPDEREVAGTITVAEMAFSGPGGTIQEALDNGPTGNDLPTLVNGVIFLDTDGTIYLASGISDVEAPTFEGPMLEVLNMDNTGTSWDLANAELLNLEEANGIVFRQGAQVLGFLELP
jgi:hypothetical protein